VGIFVFCMLAFVSSALAQQGTPTRQLEVTPTEPATWDGDTATGTNVNYNFDTGEPCEDPDDGGSPSPTTRCDRTLLNVQAGDFFDDRSGGVQISIGDYSPNPESDFDLQVFESDAAGTKGQLVGSSADFIGVEESTTVSEASGHYLIQVVYFAVTESGYTGEAKFVSRDRLPPDIDDPPGLQESLASDPSLGFRSHSEPHIAQSPTDPNLLVAGSKQYNRDPDSLPEYEFKIGTYVSFDGGRTWTDLGQTAVCPPDEAPPESWPDNTCYPEEDPGEEGTGEEDPEGGTDFAEEYINSDPWVQFDDEGNAYLMVLDAPPFESGNGWGMTLHRWETPSPEDLEPGGETWSERIPINAYGDGARQELFLDDKNTFAVNNAGEDGDGETGIMIACWGQNIPVVIKQQTVCDRSTDGGMTWPDEPTPISDVQQLVIGVHVFADPQDPDTFYATWLQYATEVAFGEATLEFATTTNGGMTWVHNPVPAATLAGIPRTFPGQAFRNLSIPIMAVGPEGELYITYAEYVDATNPDEDEDGMEADISLIKSTDGGASWSEPVTVNQEAEGDNQNADQFQPYLAVTPGGQVNVIYFDRREDVPKVSGETVTHPGNFFIDTYLSRSNDGGETFTDVRLSHDMWDPTINPPISPSGDFIGDYQGLVADDFLAIPFVNDTHLANDPARDPDFDDGLPRSEFQEVFSWRVPNTAEFGGQPVVGVDCQPANGDGDGGPGGPGDQPTPPGGGPGGPGGDDGDGGPCSNRISGTDRRDKLTGTKGSDRISGKRGRDRIKGKGGDDCLLGKGGRDKVMGGGGDDQIRGGGGRDKIKGGGGDDEIRGGKGQDRINAGGGNDVIRAARGGRDRIDCGPGRDKAFINASKDRSRRCEKVKLR